MRARGLPGYYTTAEYLMNKKILTKTFKHLKIGCVEVCQ
jgi:hypothetical protein